MDRSSLEEFKMVRENAIYYFTVYRIYRGGSLFLSREGNSTEEQGHVWKYKDTSRCHDLWKSSHALLIFYLCTGLYL